MAINLASHPSSPSSRTPDLEVSWRRIDLFSSVPNLKEVKLQNQRNSCWALRLGAQAGTETKEQNHRTTAMHIHHTQGQAHVFGTKLGGSLNKCRKHIPCICYSNS